MEWFNGRPRWCIPTISRCADEADEPAADRAGLSADRRPVAKVLRRAIGQALARLPDLPEWQDASVMRAQSFPAVRRRAARGCTIPRDPIDVAPTAPAWRRLAYDELLASQLSLALVRAHDAAAGRARR